MSIFGDAIYFCGGGGGGKSVDTGLGWCADEDWLMNQSGVIASLTKPLSSDNLIGSTINTGLGWSANSDYLVNTAGTTLVSINSGPGGWRTFKKYNNGYAISVFVNAGWGYFGPLTISTEPDYVTQIMNDRQIFTPRSNVSYLGKTWYYVAEYWYGSSEYSGYDNLNVPAYNANWTRYMADLVVNVLATAGVADAPVVETIEYDKSAAGYSVACMCKWITSIGGDVYFSPVLISSVEANTAYTRNSTAISGTTTHTYEGMTFYMRKGTNDTLSGTETITSYVPLIDLTGDTYTDDTIFTTIMSAAYVCCSL